MDTLRPLNLKAYFEDTPDPRCEYLCSHKLIDILMIGLCATIAGSDSWSEIVEFAEDREPWLRSFLELPEGIPSHDTFERVFARLDPQAFEERFRDWVSSVVVATEGQVIAIDGKAIRRARDMAAGKETLYMVSAWAAESRLVLGQTKVHEKSNEITAIPELLEVIDIAGCIVTIDAIGCQRKIAEQILRQKGDYILAVKGNQPDLSSKMQHVLGGATPERYPEEVQYAKTEGKGHGRVETRHCWVIQDQDHLHYLQHGQERWAGLRTLIKVASVRRHLGEPYDPLQAPGEVRYYISSLNLSPEEALQGIRSHWSIENSLHWCLDMSFREDESRFRKDHGPENLAVVRHMAINLLKQDTQAKSGIHARRLRAARSTQYLEAILRF